MPETRPGSTARVADRRPFTAPGRLALAVRLVPAARSRRPRWSRRPGASSGGPRGKRKGDWWRRWTWKKALAVTGSAFVLFILALVGVYYDLANSATIPTAFAANVTDQSTTVYYSDGHTVLGTIGSIDRQDLTINQIPKSLQDAVISAEDRGFRTEGGISPTGILRAAYEDLSGAAAPARRAVRRSPRSSSGTTTRASAPSRRSAGSSRRSSSPRSWPRRSPRTGSCRTT